MIRTEAAPRTDLFDQLVLARRFEQEVRRLQLSSTIEGAVHLATGHEAVSVGVGAAVRSEDWVACTYRGHGHALARGVPPRALVAELVPARLPVGRAITGVAVQRRRRLLRRGPTYF